MQADVLAVAYREGKIVTIVDDERGSGGAPSQLLQPIATLLPLSTAKLLLNGS